MKTKILFLLALTIIMINCSCAKPNVGQITNEYDYVLKIFNDDLRDLGYRQIDFSGLSIGLKDLNGKTGHCYKVSNQSSGESFISLNPKYTHLQLVTTLYHEIGHCYYGLYHVNDKSNIMHPANIFINSGELFLSNKIYRQEILRKMIQGN